MTFSKDEISASRGAPPQPAAGGLSPSGVGGAQAPHCPRPGLRPRLGGGGQNRALCAGASLGVTEDARVWEPGVGGSDQEGEHFKSRAPSPGRWEPIKSPEGRVFP